MRHYEIMDTNNENMRTQPVKRFDRMHIVLFVLLAVVVTAALSYWAFNAYLFPTQFTPVTLNNKEQRVLDSKLERLESFAMHKKQDIRQNVNDSSEPLEPEVYSEKGASREISLTEDELNALLAKNTDLADKLAVDLSEDLISAKLLMPVDEDFPVLGGKTLKVRGGIELAYREKRPIVILKGLSVMGVPIPNAWLGGLKNIDLVREFGGEQGFWKSFADGIETVQIADGELKLKLKE